MLYFVIIGKVQIAAVVLEHKLFIIHAEASVASLVRCDISLIDYAHFWLNHVLYQ